MRLRNYNILLQFDWLTSVFNLHVLKCDVILNMTMKIGKKKTGHSNKVSLSVRKFAIVYE